MEVPNILRENWKEFNKRVKPILKIMKEELKKDLEQGILLQGLTDLINSNTESITKLINSTTSLITTKKSEASASSTPSNDAGTVKMTKLTKPTKVPS